MFTRVIVMEVLNILFFEGNENNVLQKAVLSQS